MRNYKDETDKRVAFIQSMLNAANADGIVYGNSGGKDCTLVGILCKMACDNTVGIIMPCGSERNYKADKTDAEVIAAQFGICTRIVDLATVQETFVSAVDAATKLTDMALANIAPRLRMTTLYSVAAGENRLVAGTGNRSETYMGYFTKWGDGACDFNPIADLTVTEVYEFLRYLNVPEHIISKPPSAGLFEGQTDEQEMGIAYKTIDNFLLNGEANEQDLAIINRFHNASGHKRRMPATFN